MAQSRRADKAPPAAAAGAGPRILKKYPNRRLYDTEISSYITLTDVKAMVLKGTAFEVRDAKTGEDLTRSILLQIILEEETGGVPMFSTSTLAQIIRFYGHAMQGMMGSYLEQNLQTFTDVQARLAEQSKGLYDPKLQSPELWTKFLSGQAPMVQNLMGNYLEQSRNVFMQMQEQLNKQAETIFPGAAGAARRPSDEGRRARLAARASCLAALSVAPSRRRRRAAAAASGARQRRRAASACRAGLRTGRVHRRCSRPARRYVADMAYDARALQHLAAGQGSAASPRTSPGRSTGPTSTSSRSCKTAATQARPQRFRFTRASRTTSSRARRRCRGCRPTAARSSPSSRPAPPGLRRRPRRSASGDRRKCAR